MSCNTTILNKICLFTVLYVVISIPAAFAQETPTNTNGSKNTYHNQLFFNRFLINPTFSLVRENKSYLNILHRNQYATFEDNSQNYFLGFSNKLNENTALGIGVYSQWSGVIQEFGFNANYAHSIKLGDKSKLTFGTNVTYFNEGLDQNRVIATSEDPTLSRAQKESKVAIQPGVTLSVGRFDFGLYAEDLLKYNQTTNNFSANLNDKSIRASLQYTHSFISKYGLFADARLMPLVQVGRNQDNSLSYIGAVLLDLPKYGWLQSTFDNEYGMSVGLGFNLNKKMSLGYLMEKDILDKDADFGWNHELSLAYTFKNDDAPLAFADISTDAKIDQIIRNYEEQILQLKAQNKKQLASNSSTNTLIDDIAEDYAAHVASLATDNENAPALQKSNGKTKNSRKANRKNQKNSEQINSDNELAYQNSLILDELIMRQDSVENARNKEFEKRFETIVRFLRKDIERTIKDNLQDNRTPKTLLASNDVPSETVVFNGQVHRNYAKVDRNVRQAEKKANSKTATKKYVINNDKSKTAQNVKTNDKLDNIASKDQEVGKHKDYAKLPIKVLNRSDIAGVEPGYYLIANVYKNKRYLKAFVNDLTKQGLNAKQFYNRENGLYYVYLADFKMKEDARSAVVNHLSGKYSDEKWIMQVSDPVATAEIQFDDL
ncbi:PorP/SprF family type IX secretion system membrane protein [Muriicola sp. Z0-33]|uniref:PorP/SprF family type IX secretion system membrane protein n=1 Tax=Muriicola sp. Z0-33 TaxID=2816957 RepID=UPI0022381FD9|nr:PorP/SprF family type IX secretion system membrane protein [Muriicola sp. Z0-33]MCW5515499.1 PorP/SprF family type IX secretion system membrane protein [Muriicola sp. Z0-33]